MSDIIFYGGGLLTLYLLILEIIEDQGSKDTSSDNGSDNPFVILKPKVTDKKNEPFNY